MDPTATLADLRELSESIIDEHDNPQEQGSLSMAQYMTIAELANDLANAVQAMDQWLSKGGFLPPSWSAGR